MLNKGFKLSLAAVTALVLSMSQDSQAREFADIYTECGLGAMIAPNNAAVAAVTNVTWDLGTTAVSSNVSSVESCKGANVKTAQFIQQTFPILEQEIAQGEGEYISAMLNVRGCDSAAHTQMISTIRNDFAQTSVNDAQALYTLVESNIASQFSANCSAI